ncbi:D-glycero-beta-D-manno-heptose 1,7-bisphosphate 7-phosphatase [Candidatus Steffania adelgidicola]|uniref:D-glycero-beta-D-manno-heptose 1,7-bisphosphate 7-phosphatase n=1 Tax=Candidatus Steffania adelgidicola TaxID=1076626 RepID=UPI001D011D68|nr:D-glycero-beta-D-manno-heptose 1,7-bisphosphate 7-phosphatase [Candidatus Steffania adelgidicola]UDG79529.1 D-glycero-beta-D-manno-heptose-1,7-bisphosphate 7-phosphatase [Candidatus Steffania adelgidicola]
MIKSLSAIFLDRDGTINTNNGYLYKIENFHFIDGVIEALRELKKTGFALVLITNQSGLARGYFNHKQFIRLTQWMNWSLINHGINFDGIYFCPHHPHGIIEELRQTCNCRKPQPGLLLDAQRHLRIDMASSYMVGDTLNDMLAAKAAGVGTRVLVRTGKRVTLQASRAADWVINSLSILPVIIKQHQKN